MDSWLRTEERRSSDLVKKNVPFATQTSSTPHSNLADIDRANTALRDISSTPKNASSATLQSPPLARTTPNSPPEILHPRHAAVKSSTENWPLKPVQRQQLYTPELSDPFSWAYFAYCSIPHTRPKLNVSSYTNVLIQKTPDSGHVEDG